MLQSCPRIWAILHKEFVMPPAIRVVGNLFPLTYFIPIARGIITKGIGIEHLWEQVAALAVYVVVVMVISTRAFRQSLD
jgi:ABC-2 type transport system permease protein